MDKALLLAAALKDLKSQIAELQSKATEIQKLEGPSGPKGDKGDQGPKGEQGERGFDGVNGKDGTDGKDGLEGESGKDGISVVDAKIDFDGSLVLYLSNGTEINAGEITPVQAEGVYTMLKNGAASLNELLPTQTGNSGKYLKTDGATVSWELVSGGEGGNNYVLTGNTTDNTETEIFIGGYSNTRIPITVDKNIFFTVDVVARETSAGNNYAGITLKSAASNKANIVSDLGDIYEVIVARSSPVISIDARADNTNKTINLYVTGLTGVTLSWRAVVTTVEV
jgi:hypothetical protein